MEGIKYVNLIEIDPVVIEIQRVKNGNLAVPVNNTLACHTAFLAAVNDREIAFSHATLCYILSTEHL